jgi:putative PIN family toxin of toxin-antitoxin system
MPSQNSSKVIIDTNLWISFLIGKELSYLKDLIVNEKIKIVTSDLLIAEIMLVTSRPKLKKYFQPEKVEELISLFDIVAEKVKLKKIESICRDPKDDFLLAMAKESKADYLITGDKDLLDIKVYRNTEILTANKFKEKKLG